MINRSARSSRRAAKKRGFTILELVFTMAATLIISIAFTNIIAWQAQMERLAIGRLTGFRRAANGAQAISDLMREGSEILEHGTNNRFNISSSPKAPSSQVNNQEYTFTPTETYPLRWRDSRIGSEGIHRVFWDEAQGALWLVKDLGGDGTDDSVALIGRGVSRVEVRLGVNPVPGDPSGALAEAWQYGEAEVEVTYSAGGNAQTMVWVRSGAYLRNPVQ